MNKNEQKIILFGFGSIRDPEYVKAILGKMPKHFPATLKGYSLFKQKGTSEQIPVWVKDILKQNWDLEKFSSLYVSKYDASDKNINKVNPLGEIHGTAYELTKQDVKKLDNWEFCEEGGWFEKEEVTIVDETNKSHKAFTYVVEDPEGEPVPDSTIWPFGEKEKNKMINLAKKLNIEE